MRDWSAARVAEAAGASLIAVPTAPGARAATAASSAATAAPGPAGATIDSRTVSPGELFVGLPGERTDGGEHALEALRAGAWGVLVSPQHAAATAAAAAAALDLPPTATATAPAPVAGRPDVGAVLAHADPLAALQALALVWRRELGASGAKVVGITGSTGKTSTKDILAALAATQRVVASSPENRNTEIGLPLAVLAAPAGTEVLVLEMAMRGSGQIAELAAIAEPDVGVIVNVGPVHLELLGTVEAIAAAKAELIATMAAGSTVVLPADEPLLTPYLRADLKTITFGENADVVLREARSDGQVLIGAHGREIALRPSFAQAHNLLNLLAAVAAALALGIDPQGSLDVRFSALRGERRELPGGVVVIDDCYNANPMSMRAAIDDLVQTAPARRVAVLGDMLELGSQAPRLHREIGLYATERGVDVLVTVGPLAAEMRVEFAGESYPAGDAQAAAELLATLLQDGDTVLVKASRGVGLELVAQKLAGERGGEHDRARGGSGSGSVTAGGDCERR
ncbi:MAG TPA: UDP-N-acetylmuramoyl-tripeptide--D-alanyl-D-alanine ligase [Solirubrobacteraceae bacterium]|jgi:UDP-N-acetylmuramoyl-tripeptide--D-alanyl-D-alanine ligase|nr:UDP-N-acetylmuramoyl-tripeptide--D-alanyl-D-alanine ligase [Solirubrobacteraceae bacterium]